MTSASPATPTLPLQPRRFGFHLPAITHAILLLPFGLFRAPEVRLDDQHIGVHMGLYRASFALADIDRFEIDGPYIWFRAIGPRHTLFHTDFSYCTDGKGAVKLYLKTQRPLHWVRRVDLIYLGVEDLEGLAAALRERGIPGTDVRRS
jgi:hypothetical protein